ncbi:MAG: hypothetical protein COA97_05265 [Flavobacteriales bacterium]|nr:MAG: hypothetical protein COA97_05265 [Flavobacteriales bacterium]
MKKLAYLFATIIFLSFASCGGDASENIDETVEVIELKGFEELNLSEWGFDLTVMVPQADIHGDPEVILTERGALEIVVGLDFGLEIMFGEGDIALLKMDLQDDLVFTSEIIKEEDNAIIYTQDIPDSGVKTQNHFLYKAEVGTDIFEVRDIIDGEFGAGMIEKMLEAAKTIKSTSRKSEVAA